MTRTGWTVLLCGLAAGGVRAQMDPNLGAAGSIAWSMRAGEPGSSARVRQEVVASLSYDGTSTMGFAGQDFESAMDQYDIFCAERFGMRDEWNLLEFRSAAFGTGNPLGATDMVVAIYAVSDLTDICDGGTLPAPLLTSFPGDGFYDGSDGVTDFGGQCLPGGDYLAVWSMELNFASFGQAFFYGQHGSHDHGFGGADDGFLVNPGGGFGMGVCFNAVDEDTGAPSGVNFVLTGTRGNCGNCSDFAQCGDWDGDGDADSFDFFAFMDDFELRDPCTDLSANGMIDAEDFFLFLDNFVLNPC